MSLSWTKENIKNLRLRLGWTQADLARRLHCESADIAHWEGGLLEPSQTVVHELEILERQAQQCSVELQNLPAAEEICQQNALSQVGFTKVSGLE